MLSSDLQKLSVTGRVTLYELDATKLGAGIFRWHGHMSYEDWQYIQNSNTNLLKFEGVEYFINNLGSAAVGSFSDTRTLVIKEPDNHGASALFDFIPAKAGETYTLSFKETNEPSYIAGFVLYDADKNIIQERGAATGALTESFQSYRGYYSRTGNSATINLIHPDIAYIRPRVGVYDSAVTDFDGYFKDIKLEKGATQTPWTPFADDDVDYGRDIIWQGNVYEPLPIKSDGLEVRGDGKASMPTLNISANREDSQGVMQIGFIRALCLQYHDLAGARLTVTNTLAQYLDATNFSDGNPQADPNEYRKQVWFTEQKTGENALSVTFELSNPVDFEGSRIPSREITSYCHWALHGRYRGQECKYMGTAMFDTEGNPTTDPTRDGCSGRLSDGCRIRNNEKNYGGFPSSSLIKG